MSELLWILGGGLLMSAIAMAGAITTVVDERTLRSALLPMVALAAGTLMGGALFHMLPHAYGALPPLSAAVWLAAGFTTFLAMEQFLNWHHSHRSETASVIPVTYLILAGDAMHNFLGGIGIASTFLIDPRAGIVAWIAGAAHEVPQELGDFAVLVHGGWSRRRALTWNLISALTFPAGALLAWTVAHGFDVTGLVLFGAGNFIYIAASDLIPEIKGERSPARSLLHFACFVTGAGLMLVVALVAGV